MTPLPACPSGKRPYASYWQAWRAQGHIRYRGKRRPETIYRCRCGAYHLGRDMRLS